MRSAVMPLVRSGPVNAGCSPPISASSGSERFQVFDEIATLGRGEAEVQRALIVRDDIGEGRGAAVVEIRRVLEQTAKRRRAISFRRRPRRVARIHTGFTRRVQLAGVDVTERGADVA